LNRKRAGLVGAAIGTAGAVGVGAAVAARRYAVGRARLRPDPDQNEPFGELRGRPLTVVASDGLPLHVEVEGPDDAPLTVVFCHGYCLSQDSWHYQRRDLARRIGGGVRMVFWDQRSHGRSGRSDLANATIEQCGEDLFAVLDATTAPGRPVVLAGHSMGGMAIMALADRHPELFGDRIAAVALINTSSGGLAELTLGLPMAFGKVFKAAAPGVIRGIGKRAKLIDRGRRIGADVAFVITRRMAFADRGVSPTVVEFLEQMIRSTPTDVIAEFYPTLAAHEKLAALDVLKDLPVLVAVGDEDRLTPAAHGRAIAAALPDADLVEVTDGGHVLMLEHPGIVTDALAELIGRARPVAEERSA
jgi:pimeloyl-ACP methyl ester carboxylesterase